MKVLVTGGAGYIGSTICSALSDAGHTPVIVDSFITGRTEFCLDRIVYPGDIADDYLLDRVLFEHPDIEAAVHCAALIIIRTRSRAPWTTTRRMSSRRCDLCAPLCATASIASSSSSSASIYQPSADFAVTEDSSIAPLSPYARTKAVVENMLVDICLATPLSTISLRYFNPIGADPLLRTGLQIPRPSHALGQIILADEESRAFTITGCDYPTRDGTGIRDYVHVWDLAAAHVAAVERFDQVVADSRSVPVNLGTGEGTTVRELVAAYERVAGHRVAIKESGRRPGDSAGAFTRSNRAADMLEWTPKLDVAEGIRDSLRWAELRPTRLRSPS